MTRAFKKHICIHVIEVSYHRIIIFHRVNISKPITCSSHQENESFTSLINKPQYIDKKIYINHNKGNNNIILKGRQDYY